jgi:hypothetical protein
VILRSLGCQTVTAADIVTGTVAGRAAVTVRPPLAAALPAGGPPAAASGLSGTIPAPLCPAPPAEAESPP